MATNQLIVFRHAKSDRPPGRPDEERPLSARGRADATAAGVALDEIAPSIDLVVSSPAQRARETWERASATYSGEPHLQIDDRVYEADVEDLMAVLRSLPEDAQVVVLVGHNPGLEDLAVELAGSADRDAMTRLTEKFPTSALALFDVPGAWAELRARGAHLASLTIPRG